MSKTYKTEETRIFTRGVFRCCLATVACEHLGKEVLEGTKSECEHCHAKFTLRVPIVGKPVWFPEQFEPFDPTNP